VANDSGAVRLSRAFVLGGGGPVGRAWQVGLVDGFASQGINLGIADLIIGTSAGAVVGAQLALKQGIGAPPRIDAAPPVYSGSMVELATAMARAAQSSEPEPIRVEIGKMALNARTISEEASVSRSIFAPYVGQAWPSQLQRV
jgi:NTE family protein